MQASLCWHPDFTRGRDYIYQMSTGLLTYDSRPDPPFASEVDCENLDEAMERVSSGTSGGAAGRDPET